MHAEIIGYATLHLTNEGADGAKILPESERAIKYEQYRAEMDTFAQFLLTRSPS